MKASRLASVSEDERARDENAVNGVRTRTRTRDEDERLPGPIGRKDTERQRQTHQTHANTLNTNI
eukprot:scaffold212704_cov32-Tisochrysis_lutea.AAC.3